jgi:hypothetical protein
MSAQSYAVRVHGSGGVARGTNIHRIIPDGRSGDDRQAARLLRRRGGFSPQLCVCAYQWRGGVAATIIPPAGQGAHVSAPAAAAAAAAPPWVVAAGK